MRIFLKGLGAGLAARRITEIQIERMEAVLRELEVGHGRDSTALMSIDKAFHNLLCEAADNAYVAERLEQLYDLSLRLWSLVLNPLEAIPYGMERHGRVLAALMEGDEVEAETIVQQHIVGFQENIRAIL